MIRYIRNAYLNRQKFDHCIRMDKLGLVYAFSWYMDEVCHNWDCLVLNDYDAVWPLPYRNKFGLKYFYRPYGVQQLGIFSKVELSEDQVLGFVKEMTQNCRYADIYMNEGQLMFDAGSTGVRLSDNTNLTLNLSRSFREIYHAYNKHTQRNIVRSSRHSLQIFEHDDPERLIELFKSNRGDDLKLDSEFYRNMGKAMYNCLHRGIGKVWTVYDERNDLCAGIFMVESEKRHTLLFSASSPEGKEMRAMYYLINEYLIYSSGKDKTFDFEGSNSPGLRRFYEGFGASEVKYRRLVFNGLPWPINHLKPSV
jgi:hypothetical protein